MAISTLRLADSARRHRMPKRPNGRGFPRIKRSFGTVGGIWVGQINVSSGTTDPDEYDRLVEMLERLAHWGQGALLVRIRDSARRDSLTRKPGRTYEIKEVYRDYLEHRRTPAIIGAKPLSESLPDWLKSPRRSNGKSLSERTIRSYTNNVRQFLKVAPKLHRALHGSKPTDADIPAMLLAYRKQCIDSDYRVPFNQVKTMLLSYARETQAERQDSDLYRAIRRVPGLDTTRKRDRQVLLPWQVKALMAKLPEREAQHVWNMCCLAVRPDEYAAGCWRVVETPSGSYVQVNGTKNGNARRKVPLSDGVKPVPYVDSTFRRHLRAAAGHELVPRDFRSTGRMWMKWAGIDPSRVRLYFGHSMGSIENRYETHEVLLFLAGDTMKLNAYIAEHALPPEDTKEQKYDAGEHDPTEGKES